MKFIELFAGIGGFRYGLEKVGEHIPIKRTGGGGIRSKRAESNDSLRKKRGNSKYAFSCVYANEWNKYAAQVYEKNYEKPDTRDIRTILSKEIPKHELITAGFPCQSFSIAGKRKGFDDTRGTLFYEICRIARFHRTPLLLLENVKGLLNHDEGQTFSIILESLDELGYDCQWQVLNSKDFGVPQNRERVFIIGHLRGTGRPKVFPVGGTSSKDIIVNGVLDTETWRKRHEQIRRTHSINGISPTLPTGTGGGVMTKILNNTRVRRLTPTECERLQGFPDGWTEGISDTQRYKCLGNAVTTNVITAIGIKLLGEK